MTRASVAGAALAGLVCLALATPSTAGTMVLAASSRAVKMRYPSGSTLPPGPVVLAAGEWLQVLAEGRVLRLQGPVTARAQAATPSEASLFARIKGAVDQIEARPLELGAVRSGPGPADPWAIDVGRSGDVCVPLGKPAGLWRRNAAAAETYTLSPPDGPARTLAWPAEADTVAWPADLPLRSGVYTLRDGDDLGRTFSLHVIAAGTTPAEALAALADARCVSQLARRIAEAP